MFVERLAAYWEFATGLKFTQSWHNRVPQTSGTEFIYAVLEFIDPHSLRHLPKMTEKVVQERRAAQEGLGEDPRLKTLGPDPFLHRKIYEPVKDG
jgi:hypothetical protein